MGDVVNVGTLPDDGTGDVDRDAFIAINQALEPLGLHLVDRGNPHAVTARQVGAYSKTEADENLKAALQGLPTLANVALAIAGAINGLNLGTAATRNVGTSAGNVLALDTGSKIPASVIPDGAYVTSVAGLVGVSAPTATQLNTALGTARLARRAALIFG